MRKTLGRKLYIGLGFFFVGLGVVGALLPIMPTVPFLLVAAFFFSKSSARWHHWLLTRPQFGSALLDWESHGVIRLRAKVFATIVLVTSSVFTLVAFSVPAWGQWGYVTVIFLVIVFIWSRPSAPKIDPTD